MAAEEGGRSLEYTPTWVVASVFILFVLVSFFFNVVLRHLAKRCLKCCHEHLHGAFEKVKEELMLMGFMSLLLLVLQDFIEQICITKEQSDRFLPCKNPKSTQHVSHLLPGRHLLAGASTASTYCSAKGKVPAVSIEALHHLHIFIFVLAVAHVVFSWLIIIFFIWKVRRWKRWEEEAVRKYEAEGAMPKITIVQHNSFIKRHFLGYGKADGCRSWPIAVFRSFFGSVSKKDYTTLRTGFIMQHCKNNPKYDFNAYLERALASDLKNVVSIRFYLWVYVIIFVLLNIPSRPFVYLASASLSIVLLVLVGANLQGIFTKMAHEVAEKHDAVEGEVVIRPSDDFFWFRSPRLMLCLIHFVIFQNSFELTFFVFVWCKYGRDSCIMGSHYYAIFRFIVALVVLVICILNTLPRYALVAQMGSSFKPLIFNVEVHHRLVEWAKNIRNGATKDSADSRSSGSKTCYCPGLFCCMTLQEDGPAHPNPHQGSNGC